MRMIRLLLAVLIFALPAASYAQVRVAIRVGPPAIPVYEQPICPGDGYLWTPGYWAYDDDISDYYWVPGLWVTAPEVGFLWTPGYWGWRDDGFFFNDGYWGPTVGFYGGINYGFGYFGVGFGGGRWDGGHFFYNRAVMNVDVTNIHNVYNTTITHNDENRVSYNGGQGGITARPTPAEEAAAHERHIAPVAAQTQHVQTARSDPQSRASVNHGNPPAAAGHGVGGAGEARGAGAGAAGRTLTHASDLPRATATPVNSGDAKADKKYQQQQEKLIAKQNKEQEQLQKKQDAEHQKKLNDADHQQMEQRHQQQTQQLQQRHASEMQDLQSRAPAPRPSSGRPR